MLRKKLIIVEEKQAVGMSHVAQTSLLCVSSLIINRRNIKSEIQLCYDAKCSNSYTD